MFEFFDMVGNYEARKIDRYEEGKLIVSTAHVNDSAFDYETAISHPNYNRGAFVIVENYSTKEDAQIGHNKWVGMMTADALPMVLMDVGQSGVQQFAVALGMETDVHFDLDEGE